MLVAVALTVLVLTLTGAIRTRQHELPRPYHHTARGWTAPILGRGGVRWHVVLNRTTGQMHRGGVARKITTTPSSAGRYIRSEHSYGAVP